MKLPQKCTAKFLRLYGCQGNHNPFLLAEKFLVEWDVTQRYQELKSLQGNYVLENTDTSLHTLPLKFH